MSTRPPTDPFTALGEAMTALGVAIIGLFESAARWASQHPTKALVILLLWLATFCTALYVAATH